MTDTFEVRKVAVLGAGKMGATLIKALLDAGVVAPTKVTASARTRERCDTVAGELGVNATTDNAEAATDADVVLLAVKPQTADRVLTEIRGRLTESQLLISILAGVSLAYIEERLPKDSLVVRAMPNTPALVGAGMTVLCGGHSTQEAHLDTARFLFRHLGRVLVLDERYFDAVTGLSASGPAFLYIVIEALAEGGVKMGLPRNVAIELAAQTCLGAGKMTVETGDHPALLKDAVTTPAGCTVDGILKLEEGGLRVTLIKAVVEAARRARELVE